MITILLDHNIKGIAVLLLGTLATQGWLEFIELRIATFDDVGLSQDSDDRTIWRFVQERQMVLLTNNRNGVGANSLDRASSTIGRVVPNDWSKSSSTSTTCAAPHASSSPDIPC